MTNSIAEIEDAGCIFIIGSNTSACHPAHRPPGISGQGKRRQTYRGRPALAFRLSRFADVAVNQRLGSDVALLNGMMHLILKNGWEAEDYIAEPDRRVRGT